MVAGLSLGIALAGAPGPVQAVLLAESVRGGIGRGFRALAGASATFGLLLVGLALGVSLAPPEGIVLRILKVLGGALLIWLAVDALRSGYQVNPADAERRSLPPSARGSLAVLFNPGAWLFLGAVASPLLAEASQGGGSANALLAAAALILGAGLGDAAVVLLGGLGLRRAGDRTVVWVGRFLALVLAGLGVWLLTQGVVPS
ncbi:MAG TPA: LysE family transporter [Actinomycetota bacterium]|nr:LysE family transporter [Actinomycetota bacterium]